MKIDARVGSSLTTAATEVSHLEELGFSGAWSAEAGSDPFFPLAVAAGSSTSIELGTNILVAFARSPMTVAASANELQRASGGRFILGLGSQVKPHIEKRYSMTWSRPADRMREYVAALRAIWSCWNEGSPLEFRGEFYTHTLTTPFFQPAPHGVGPARIFLAAVGPAMTAVAGETCDGLLVHPFTTTRYLREVTLPAIDDALTKVGRARQDFTVACSPMVVTGEGEEQLAKSARAARREIAFHASTPAYRTVLDYHGWGALQPELNELSKQGRWREMTDLVDDEMLNEFAVVGPPTTVAETLLDRYDTVADRLSVHHGASPPAPWEQRLAALATSKAIVVDGPSGHRRHP